MPKNIPPEMGHPGKEMMHKLWSDTEKVFIERYEADSEDEGGKEHVAADEKPIVDALTIFAEEITPLINEDACMSEDQWRETFSVVANARGNHVLLRKMADNPVDMNRVYDMELQLEVRIAGLINGYSLQCHNCLNDKCEKRDPLVPLESVKARVKGEE